MVEDYQSAKTDQKLEFQDQYDPFKYSDKNSPILTSWAPDSKLSSF